MSQNRHNPMGARTRRGPWLEFLRPISTRESALLGLVIWVLFFVGWEVAAWRELVNPLLLPPPEQVLISLYDLLVNRGFAVDIGVSILRILASFVAACIIAIPLGVLMGSFARIEGLFNPFVSAWRYLPAPAFIPILLAWFGTGEEPKLALLFLGVIWFLITLVMDHTRNVRDELIETAMTLGASRWQVLWTVIVPAVLPNILIAMRQMLAIAWTYLVIAEIIAATNGIGAVMWRARRFLDTDEILAGILVIGVLGLAFDLLFRWLYQILFPYLDRNGR